MERGNSKFFLLFICLLFTFVSQVDAKLNFSSRNDSIVLKTSDSRLKLSSVDSLKGWKEMSIVLESGNDHSWVSDNIVYGFESGDTEPPNHLIYNDSNAIVNNSWAIESNHEDIVENSNAIVNNSWSVQALRDDANENSNAIVNNSWAIQALRDDANENSNAIVTIDELVKENSNAILNAGGSNELAEQNSNAIINLQEDINENSQAIVTNRGDIINNSNSIITIEQTGCELAIQNSNSIVDQSRHFISINDGRLYAVGSIIGETFINGRGILSSPINLNGATLTNGGDLLFSSQTTVSSSGYLSPQGHAYILGGDLLLPDDVILTFTSSGIIDGQGHRLVFGNNAQILIDSAVTVTLKNLTVKNDVGAINTFAIQPIKCLDCYSKLALDNVTFALNNDFIYPTGQMYFYDDVKITGTSKFSYRSVLPSYIQPHSNLYFGSQATFDYYPSSVRNDLIVLNDETSFLCLDGATLQTTETGIKLTKGQVFFDNKVTLSNSVIRSLSNLSQVATVDFSSAIASASWSPDGKYFAAGGSNGAQDLIVYSWNGSSLTQLDSIDFSSDVISVDWSSDSKYLAVGGNNGTQDLIVCGWNGSSLTQLDTIDFGGYINSVDWSSDGKYLAIGGHDGLSDLIVYSWNGSSLTQLDTKDFDTRVNSVDWSFDGKYLAVGGFNSSNDLIVYSWNGSSLTQLDTVSFGTDVRGLSWSFDGKYLAVGGHHGLTCLIVYEWDGSSLTQLDAKSFGTDVVLGVSWSSDGKYLAVSGINDPTDLIVYEWNGSTLIQKVTEDFGNYAYSVAWSPDGNYLSVSGQNGSSDLIIFNVNYSYFQNPLALNNSIIFGDSQKGSSYDLDMNILSGAQVIIDGQTIYDPTSASGRLEFANMGASVVLSDANSKFGITNSNNISGWKEQSIVNYSGNDNSWISDNTIYGYSLTDTNPPTHLIFNNSNAIVNNSWAIESNHEDIVENSNAIVNNSWAIEAMHLDVVENSNAIVNLEEDVAENSNAIVNISEDVIENSNAIVNIESDLAIENSNAIINLEEDISENSSALITCCANANDLIQQNSMAIVLNRSIIDLHDNIIEQNSEAIISNAYHISDLEQDVAENSNAIVNLDNEFGTLVVENSNAIVNSESDLAVENSNAILNLQEDINENSQAIVTNRGDIINNSNSIITIEQTGCELAEQNSNAIVNLEPELTIENSNAIIHMGSLSTDLIIENSNAIVNNSSFIAQELIIENSNAIATITQDYLFSDPIITDVEIGRSLFVQPDQRIFIDGDVTIDGKCAVLYFASNGESSISQFVIADGRTVILKNISLTGIRSNTFDFGKNSTLVIGENVSWELHEDMTFASGKIILQNQTSNGIDIANLFYIHGMNGKKRLTFFPNSGAQLPMFDVGQNTLALQNIEFTGLEYVSHSVSSDGLLTGAVGLAGETAVNVEKSNNMVFAIMGLSNIFRLLENNLTFNGQLDFVGLGEDAVHFDFVLRSPVESVNAGTQLADGKVPVVNFATNFIYLTSLNGIARILFDDAIVRINNAANAFIVTNNGYLAANTLLVSGDPIWDESNGTAKNRFAIEGQEIVAVKATGDGYERVLPEFGIPIVVDAYHSHRLFDIDLVKTIDDLIDVRPKSALQIELEK